MLKPIIIVNANPDQTYLTNVPDDLNYIVVDWTYIEKDYRESITDQIAYINDLLHELKPYRKTPGVRPTIIELRLARFELHRWM